ncbi:hypothetical protein ACA910_006571 [Epithemia clementina (nom. ined.)]
MVVDHGHVELAYYVSQDQVAVVFAGLQCKADNVIANTVEDLVMSSSSSSVSNHPPLHIVVVTADQGLIRIATNRIHLQPLTLLEDLEYILEHIPHHQHDVLESDLVVAVEPNNAATTIGGDGDSDQQQQQVLLLLDHKIIPP